jgi:5'(3')-deoxyribonucleotidase
MKPRVIHFDLDGVLADFRKSFVLESGLAPEDLSADKMWSRVAAVPEFFLRLDVLDSGRTLFDMARKLGEVRILTALPRKTTYQAAEDEKRRWAAANFPEATFVAVQYASQKANHAVPGDVLIDDSPDNIRRWIRAGGVGLLYTNVEATASALLEAFSSN